MLETSTQTERQQVFAITEAEVSAVKSGDIDLYISLLSDDAVFLPPNTFPKSGDELRHWLREFMQRVSIKYASFVHGETIIRDDLACHFYACSWAATPKSGGQATLMHFKGIHILRRQPDGAWKISRSIWNADPTPS